MNVVCSKVKVSYGTANVLRLKRGKNLVDPTTAYIMIGNKCSNNCEFCVQSDSSERLSRVRWPEFDLCNFIEAFKKKGDSFFNVCIQVTNSLESIKKTIDFIKKFKDEVNSDVKINVSVDLSKYPDYFDVFFNIGVNRIGISIDCVSKKLFNDIKHKDYDKSVSFLINNSKRYGDRISTHIIVGLGETDKDIVDFLFLLKEKNIGASLFAYTPGKKGTSISLSSPDIIRYRKIQIFKYLLYNSVLDINSIVFDKELNISDIRLNKEQFKIIEKGEFLRTSGCKHCNRPFYNEKVCGDWFNYPRKAQSEEIDDELSRLKGFLHVL